MNASLCERCGVHLLGRPHPVVVLVDGSVAWRMLLCVRCRDEAVPVILDAAGDTEREFSHRVQAPL